jgi:hypothetical protein
MKRLIIVLLVLGLVIFGCTSTPQQTPVVCNPPYIQVGTSCCLDQNQNSICDKDEPVTEQQIHKGCAYGTVVCVSDYDCINNTCVKKTSNFSTVGVPSNQSAQNETNFKCSQSLPYSECSVDNKSIIAYVCQNYSWKSNVTPCDTVCSDGKCLSKPEVCPNTWPTDRSRCNVSSYIIQAGGHTAVFYNMPTNPKSIDIFIRGANESSVDLDLRLSNGNVAAGGVLNVCETMPWDSLTIKVIETKLNPRSVKVEVWDCKFD